MRRLLLLLVLLGIVGFASPAAARPAPWVEGGPSKGEDLHIYLVTFGVGDDIASWFGHTALMVRDDGQGEERVYNYGMFSFGPDMLPKFLMGRLEFWVGEAPVGGTMRLYESLNRDIYRSELNLSPAKRREMAAFLAWNVEPENRNYLYHHYNDNCATRIRDAIDKAVGGQLAAATKDPSRTTFRGHTHRHTQRNAYIDLLLSMWMNDEIDAPLTEWEDMFLPGELLHQVESLEFTDESGARQKLVPQTVTVFKSNRPTVPHMPSSRWWWTLIVGIVLGGAGLLFARRWDTTHITKWRLLLGGHHFLIGLLFGLPGLVAVLFHFTEHTITWWNENMLLWSPLTFLALPLSIPIMRARPWALRTMRIGWYVMAVTSVLAILLKVLPMFDQQNGFALAMMAPFNILMAAAMSRFGPAAKHGELTKIVDGVWGVSSNRRFLDLELGSRTTIVRLSDGTLWVHSPIGFDSTLKEAVDAMGKVAHIVAPSAFHHMHVGEWAAAYPEAKIYAAPGVAAKRPDLSEIIELGAEPPEAWGGDIEMHHVAGAPILNEICFYHGASKTLIVTDLIENFGTSDHLPTRIYLKVMKMENRCCVAPVVKAAFTDRRAAQASVEAILAWDFDRITLCHGAILVTDAREKLSDAFRFLSSKK